VEQMQDQCSNSMHLHVFDWHVGA